MIRSRLPFSFSQVCKPSPLTSAGSSAAQGVSKQRLKHYNYDHIFNSSQLCAVLYHFLPSSTLTIIIRSHTFKYLERMNTERKQDNFQKLNTAIHLLGRWQYFFLRQFLGNHRTNGGSQDRRQQRRPLLTVGSRKVEFSAGFPQLILLWILHCHVSIVNKWQYDHRHEAGS